MHARNVTCSPDVRSRSGFCATTPPAYAAAAAMHSAAPRARVDRVLARREADDDGAGERDCAPGDQRAREALAQEQSGEQGDEDGADVDEHRGSARVDAVLGGVEDDVV